MIERALLALLLAGALFTALSAVRDKAADLGCRARGWSAETCAAKQ